MTDTVRVEGLQRLVLTLHAAARRIANLSDPSRRTASYTETRSRADAPRLTGRLAASVRADVSAEGVDTGSALAYANRTHWGYARYGQRAQPFVLNAVTTGEVVIVNNYEEHVDRVLGGVRGK